MRVVPRAWWYAVPMFVLALVLIVVSPWLAGVVVLTGGAMLYFYRDPDRISPPTGVLSPADGKVSVLRAEDDRWRVGIYMNVLDVHVNRAPVAGTIHSVDHRRGSHRPAFSKESDRNELVRMRIDGGGTFEIDLIAGAVARRISPYVTVGDAVDRGERIGHIAFGSRADVLLPAHYERDDIVVTSGERVRAGETILARQ